MSKPLSIIGLDPGTTAAYTVLDLSGKPLQSYSAKELPLSQIISRVIEISKPLVAATDKENLPSLVREFSAKLGTILVIPPRDLQREEKKDLTRLYQEQIKGSHQLDALAAAFYAYKKLKPTLIKIDQFIKKNDLEGIRNPFTQLVLKEGFNLESAREILTHPQEEENQIIRPVLTGNKLTDIKLTDTKLTDNKITKADFLKLLEKLEQAKKEKTFLEDKIIRLKQAFSHQKQANFFLAKKLAKAGGQTETLLKFKEKRIQVFSQELNRKEKEKEALSEEIKGLKELFFDLEDKIIVGKVKDLGQNFQRRNFPLKEGGCLFVENPAVVSAKIWEGLKEKGIKLFSKSKKKDFFVLDDYSDKGDFIIAARASLEKAMSRRDVLEEVMDEYHSSRTVED